MLRIYIRIKYILAYQLKLLGLEVIYYRISVQTLVMFYFLLIDINSSYVWFQENQIDI